ncbi:hypothetical protein MAPG_01724 [Magnaporthiopsis poae ATCC 64411]|uniref:DUF676 domain-containing protein n=1 Tax=Magnaporthiopsis poae (strain ATCC 64411 / 73-15) TaxID=644358 RepID=A0A0C4DPF9_MAGP6|nr:hypothetical protein MAPG_01724 [Magnaporthiopsis poae ATCC 64411]
MLLLHQVGSVRIGEVVRYTVTYTPSHDRILPSPECLHLRIKNTSLIALRAAFVHGPYTLSVAAYPAHYDPNRKFANPRRYGVPEFEPMLKAGGVWSCRLLVPDNIRQSAGCGVSQGHFGGAPTTATTDPANLTSSSSSTSEATAPQPALDSASWVIEISSQVIFSTSAAVNYEILLARDEKSLSLGAPAVPVIGGTHAQAPQPGKLSDFTLSSPGSQQQQPQGRGTLQKGVYSGAIRLKVEDTAALWDTPRLGHPSPSNLEKAKQQVHLQKGSAPETTGPVSTAPQSQPQSGPADPDGKGENGQSEASAEPRSKDGGEGSAKLDDNKQKIHLVVLTHGLHSNLGADMLFLKESIDSAARQAKIDGRTRRAREAQERREERRKQREERLQEREKQAAKAKEGEEEEHGSASMEALAEAESEDAKGVSAPEENSTEVGSSVNTSSAPKTDSKSPHLEETDLPDDGEDSDGDDQVVEDDEEVVVRGFSGNATRTERGIKYLGKRLARYILSMTYPDQPFLPASMAIAKEAVAQTAAKKEGGASGAGPAPAPAHKHSTIRKAARAGDDTRTYRITKISFVGHSLGGLVQLYAIAYIQKHSPDFFRVIEPINFIALASPLLGLNHENPLYFKFALDFGLVGRTGQDLGLTWRAPTIARSGWSAIVSNLGENAHKKLLGGEAQAESKPLLRILPTGPAHVALRAFRNRTLYSNVVNDGIVPLRTSCLLFLDWQGLGRVEKARREAGLVETVVGFGWSELMGANVTSPRATTWQADDSDEEADGSSGMKKRQSTEGGSDSSGGRLAGLALGGGGDGDESPNRDGAVTPMAPNAHEVPQPSGNAILEDDRQSIRSVTSPAWGIHSTSSVAAANPFTGIFNFFRKDEPAKETPPSQKQTQIFKRSQTLLKDMGSHSHSASSSRSKVTSGHELSDEPSENGMSAPPRTTFFEAAGDLLNPKLPSVEYLIDPSKRPRTIFHDRIYHPSDIPPPPLKKRPTSSSRHIRRRSKVDFSEDADADPTSLKPTAEVAGSSETGSGSGLAAKLAAAKQSISMPSSPVMSPQQILSPQSTILAPITDDGGDASGSKRSSKEPAHVVDSAGMRVEEKIARAYHRGLSWRKVLVKLEPDAHNNIIVRRTGGSSWNWTEKIVGKGATTKSSRGGSGGGGRSQSPAGAGNNIAQAAASSSSVVQTPGAQNGETRQAK